MKSEQKDDAVSMPRAILESLIAMANSHVEDIESGIEEGIYERADNDDIGQKRMLDREPITYRGRSCIMIRSEFYAQLATHAWGHLKGWALHDADTMEVVVDGGPGEARDADGGQQARFPRKQDLVDFVENTNKPGILIGDDYIIRTEFKGAFVTIERQSDGASVSLQGDDASLFWDSYDTCRDDDQLRRLCSDYDEVMSRPEVHHG